MINWAEEVRLIKISDNVARLLHSYLKFVNPMKYIYHLIDLE